MSLCLPSVRGRVAGASLSPLVSSLFFVNFTPCFLRRMALLSSTSLSKSLPSSSVSSSCPSVSSPAEYVDWQRHLGADDPTETYRFSKWPIERGIVFFWSSLSIAFTNLKPVVPGHVLIIPKRVVPNFRDLAEEEVKDLFASACLVASLVVSKHKADSFSITLQDGRDSGQTVSHVHLHVLPRFQGDLERRPGVDREEQKPRTREDMAVEAAALREWMLQLSQKRESCI
ncbi:diadenosine tetraphosphatase family protein [Toxoplasma gondii VAND]|uniref:Diadenosine tetraphosphatase family protein n=1 Tax=Toxoplasma gondii VAND TaxID=933077 RepID=A0A086PU79_TOXGO|nr:diadenosine tetraphosphatase family protein [Toxoplasma gondii VAND]